MLLIGLLVDPGTRLGPFGAQGVVMFALYLVGAVSAMGAAWVFSRIGRGSGPLLPFYMEMPPYRVPSLRSVALSVWEACRAFLSKVARIILVTTIVLWLLLNLPGRSASEMQAAGVDARDDTAVSQFVLDHSYAADVGHAMEPVFDPLGFDWRINIGVLSSLAAREVFVATLGQVFAPDVVAALLVFFLFALQCMSTIAVMRRETGTWRWPAIAFSYMFVLAWSMALLTRVVVGAVT